MSPNRYLHSHEILLSLFLGDLSGIEPLVLQVPLG